MRAIQLNRFGGPEVLEIAEVDPPRPGPGSIVVAASVAGVNFTDVNHRAGVRGGNLPAVPGIEGAGKVAELGEGVTGFSVGEPVVWKAAPGSYAAMVSVKASELVAIPEAISEETAGAAFLQGLTAQYLADTSYPVAPGDTVLVHAGAGGVGLALIQFVVARGGRVIATTSTAEKARIASEAGAAAVIRYDETDFVPVVKELTGGVGVPAVYDGIGLTTFEQSLACLAPRGILLLYGTASGTVPPFDLARLAGSSLAIARPSLPQHTATRDELLGRSDALFSAITNGSVKIRIGGSFPLEDARLAHERLAARDLAGKLILTL